MRVTVFVAAGCPHCAALLADLERRRVPYVCVDVGREPARLREIEALTWERRLPVVLDHERCSVGFRGGSSTWAELGLEGEQPRPGRLGRAPWRPPKH